MTNPSRSHRVVRIFWSCHSFMEPLIATRTLYCPLPTGNGDDESTEVPGGMTRVSDPCLPGITRPPNNGYDPDMNREERIVWARSKAAESAPERARKQAEEEAERSARIASMGHADANRAAHELATDKSVPWMGPVSTPHEWSIAVEAARAVSIEAARLEQTITYGELRVASYEATGMKVGHNQFAELAMSVNRTGDGCLLSSIIVTVDSGEPGAGFLPFAHRQGFDQPIRSLQRHVYEHFGSDE